jgi:hypothetical protein
MRKQAHEIRKLPAGKLGPWRVAKLKTVLCDALHDLDVLEGRLDECEGELVKAVGRYTRAEQRFGVAEDSLITLRHERAHWHQRAREAGQKLQAMTESWDFWKQMVKDNVPAQDHDITSET